MFEKGRQRNHNHPLLRDRSDRPKVQGTGEMEKWACRHEGGRLAEILHDRTGPLKRVSTSSWRFSRDSGPPLLCRLGMKQRPKLIHCRGSPFSIMYTQLQQGVKSGNSSAPDIATVCHHLRGLMGPRSHSHRFQFGSLLPLAISVTRRPCSCAVLRWNRQIRRSRDWWADWGGQSHWCWLTCAQMKTSHHQEQSNDPFLLVGWSWLKSEQGSLPAGFQFGPSTFTAVQAWSDRADFDAVSPCFCGESPKNLSIPPAPKCILQTYALADLCRVVS